MTDLHAKLAAAQRRVSDISAQIERVTVLEPGGALYLAIADAIRTQRKRAGLTQQALASDVGNARQSTFFMASRMRSVSRR